MVWNFQCVKCVGKHVDQDNGRKRGGREAELQERIRKESAFFSSAQFAFSVHTVTRLQAP